jgi:hypothetical protein
MKVLLIALAALVAPLSAQDVNSPHAVIYKRTAAKGDASLVFWVHDAVELCLVSAETNRRVYVRFPRRGEYRVETLQPGRYEVFIGKPDPTYKTQKSAVADTDGRGTVRYVCRSKEETPSGEGAITILWEPAKS